MTLLATGAHEIFWRVSNTFSSIFVNALLKGFALQLAVVRDSANIRILAACNGLRISRTTQNVFWGINLLRKTCSRRHVRLQIDIINRGNWRRGPTVRVFIP